MAPWRHTLISNAQQTRLLFAHLLHLITLGFQGWHASMMLMGAAVRKLLLKVLLKPQAEVHATEELLLDAFVEAFRALDPDIVVGFEVQKGSLGYLVDRAAALERGTLLREVSRIPEVRTAPPAPYLDLCCALTRLALWGWPKV